MKALLTTCDTSLLVSALHRGQPMHEQCRAWLPKLDALPAHALLESYRVLTSMKAMPVLNPGAVMQALSGLRLPHVQLPPGEYLEIVQIMARAKRPGGAVYDAQIAATAKHHGLTLLTRDRRATATYELIGVDYQLI